MEEPEVEETPTEEPSKPSEKAEALYNKTERMGITFPDGNQAGYYNVQPITETKDDPTLGESWNAAFNKYNDIGNAKDWIGKKVEQFTNDDLNPFRSNWVEGFDSLSRENVEGIPVKYWDKLANAHNPSQHAWIKNQILEEMSYDDTLDRSGFLTTLTASLAAGILSPTSLIPVAASYKYAKMGDNIFKNTWRTLPALAASSALSNAVIATNQQTKGISDWASETMADTIVGGLLTAGAFGLGAGKRALTPLMLKSKINGIAKGSMDGVDIKVKADENGRFAGYEASASEGQSAGAMKVEVDRVQELLDNGIAGIGESKLFKKIFAFSPIVRGLTSDFAIVRSFTNGFFKHNVVTNKVAAGTINDSAAENVLNLYRARHTSTILGINQIWQKKVGLEGPYADFRHRVQKETTLTQADFHKQVAESVIKNAPSPDPDVKQAVDLIRKEFFDPIRFDLEGLQKLKPGQKPRTAESYLNIIYDKGLISLRENEFLSFLSGEIKRSNYAIHEYNAPIEAARENIRLTRERYDELTNLYKAENIPISKTILREQRRAVSENLARARRQLAESKVSLQEKIDLGEVDDLLLDGLPQFNHTQIQELKQLHKAFNDAKAEYKQAKRAKIKLGTLKAFNELERAKASELGREYLGSALKDLRENGKARTLSILKNYKNDAINNLFELKAQRKTLSLQSAEREGLQEDIAIATQELTARREVLNGMREGLKEKFILPEELAADIQDATKLIKKVGAKKEKSDTFSAQDRLKRSAKKIKDAEANLKKLEEDLAEKVNAKAIDENLYYIDRRGKVRLQPLEGRPKLRRAIDDDYVHSTAQAVRDTILQENDQQMSGRLFRAKQAQGTNPLKSRTLLIPHERVMPWTITDLDQLLGTYSENMGRVVGSEKFFRRYGADKLEGESEIIRLLKDEYERLRAPVLNQPPSDARDMRLIKLQKTYDKNVKFLSDAYSVFMGNYGEKNPKIAQLSRNLRNYQMSTLLGNVLLLSFVDVANALFRLGFKDFMTQGLLPAIKQMKHLRITNQITRQDIIDSNLGLNMSSAAHVEQVWGAGLQTHPKTGADKFFSNTAKVAGNAFLVNPWNDLMQTMVATTSQAKTIRSLRKHVRGEKLTQKEIERLGILRLNYQEMKLNKATGLEESLAERIVAQQKKHGWKQDGAYVANFAAWEDFEASNAFKISVNQEVDSVVLKPNMLDIPFALRNPYVSVMTQFMSYAFAATNSFTIPLLQRPDAQKIYGVLGMMLMGSMVGPMRQIVRGEEPTLDVDKLITEGIFNSGVLGFHGDILTKGNSVLDIRLLRPYQIDRFKTKSPGELAFGPLGGTLSNWSKMFTMFANNEINEADLMRGSKIIPLDGAFWLQDIQKNIIESLGLPKNRAEAKRRHGE